MSPRQEGCRPNAESEIDLVKMTLRGRETAPSSFYIKDYND
ncbi:hypothetical protein SAMN05216367_2425 [Tardiphaga sp. OK245]|nr:hypothetical protein SAMN05216367_2425 [Tardiphaga sp. OK245]